MVFPSFRSRFDSGDPKIFAPNMALALAAATLLALLAFCLAFASLGSVLLRFFRLEMEFSAEHLLIAIAVGLIATEILLFFVQITEHIRLGCLAVTAFLFCLLLWNWAPVWERLKITLRQIAPLSLLTKFLLTILAVVASVEFLSALAPLTGSDALQYHFAVQKEILEHGFHPLFSNSHSFMCGQHHLLILLGLALGSEKLALGFIYLGGILTAAAFACLASRWASQATITSFALIFLLTPVVFWQMTSSGSPDIYMAFLASTAMIVLGRINTTQVWRQLLLAGFLAGGIAGAKYTGCFISAAIALAVVMEFPNLLSASAFLAGSLASGIWPYLRNVVWTANPVFPFLSARLSPQLVTTYAMANVYSDTGTSHIHNLSQVLPFLFFAGIRTSGPGLWEFFGPTILFLFPLILLAFKSERRWRILTLVWFASSLAIAFSSGLARFLLPVFPLGLAGAVAGLEVSIQKRWTIVSSVAGCLLVLTGLACAAGFAIYSRDSLRVAVGIREKPDYLRDRGPDYQLAQTVNGLLGGHQEQQRTLVFLRHPYYLDIPYVNGDPSTTFEIDPLRMQSSEDWKAFFKKKNIAYVVRSPAYPNIIAAPLEEMEKNCELLPMTRAEVENFLGKRIEEKRTTIPVVILRVSPQ